MFRMLFSSAFPYRTSDANNGAGDHCASKKNTFNKNKFRSLKAFPSSPVANALRRVLSASTSDSERSDTAAREELVEVATLDAGSNADCASTEPELSPMIFTTVPELSDSVSVLSSFGPITPLPLIHHEGTLQPAPPQTTDQEFSATQYFPKSAVPQECVLKSRFSENSSIQGAVVEFPPGLTNAFQADIPPSPTGSSYPVAEIHPGLIKAFQADIPPSTTNSASPAAETPSRLPNAFQHGIPPSSTHSAKSAESLSQLSGTTGLGLSCLDEFNSASFDTTPAAPIEAPEEPRVLSFHSECADIDGASSDLSFHELSSGKMKFLRRTGGVFKLEFSAGVIPSSKGHPITYEYNEETGERYLKADDIAWRCPTVRVSVRKYVDGETVPYCYSFYYIPRRLLGRGGFGCAVLYGRRETRALYTADQEVADLVSKFMVVKFILDPQSRGQIDSKMTEMNHMLALQDCPWTVSHLGDDYAVSEGRMPSAITMPFYSATLQDLFDQVPRPQLDEVKILLLAQLLVAVHNIHQSGFGHFDLKPENIFLSNTGHIVIGDLGLSHYVGLDGKLPSHCVGGTFRYRAPEIETNEVCKQAADWYSVGVIAYELLSSSGETHPFEDVNGISVVKPLHDLRYPEGDLVMKLLNPNPAKRLTDLNKMMRHPVFEENGTIIDWEKVQNRRGNGLVRDLLAVHFNGVYSDEL